MSGLDERRLSLSMRNVSWLNDPSFDASEIGCSVSTQLLDSQSRSPLTFKMQLFGVSGMKLYFYMVSA